jgi:hypothetical protein
MVLMVVHVFAYRCGRIVVPGAFLNLNTIEVCLKYAQSVCKCYFISMHLMRTVGVSIATEEGSLRWVWISTLTGINQCFGCIYSFKSWLCSCEDTWHPSKSGETVLLRTANICGPEGAQVYLLVLFPGAAINREDCPSPSPHPCNHRDSHH